MQYIVYDCEIIKLIPPKNGARLDGYEYCEGWSDYPNMGVAVVGWGCFDADNSFRSAYWTKEDNLFPLADWMEQPIVPLCGFNSKKFDDNLLAANGVLLKTDYDLLEEIVLAAGDAGVSYWKEGRTYKLSAIAEANGLAKTGTGELAPKLWQEREHKQVINYCLSDVFIINELMRRGWEGRLVDPNTGNYLKLRGLHENAEG